MIKTYTSKYFYYSFYINFAGGVKNIVLQGGNHLAKTNGIFTTSDEDLQDAIEQSKHFQKGIVFIKSSYGKKEKTEAKPIVKEVAKEVKTPEEKTEDTHVKVYEDIVTVQQASRLINKEYKVAFAQISTKDKILAKANELNISFPNLK
jgi:hypothetical protein